MKFNYMYLLFIFVSSQVSADIALRHPGLEGHINGILDRGFFADLDNKIGAEFSLKEGIKVVDSNKFSTEGGAISAGTLTKDAKLANIEIKVKKSAGANFYSTFQAKLADVNSQKTENNIQQIKLSGSGALKSYSSCFTEEGNKKCISVSPKLCNSLDVTGTSSEIKEKLNEVKKCSNMLNSYNSIIDNFVKTEKNEVERIKSAISEMSKDLGAGYKKKHNVTFDTQSTSKIDNIFYVKKNCAILSGFNRSLRRELDQLRKSGGSQKKGATTSSN